MIFGKKIDDFWASISEAAHELKGILESWMNRVTRPKYLAQRIKTQGV
jgi:hypothetical protein